MALGEYPFWGWFKGEQKDNHQFSGWPGLRQSHVRSSLDQLSASLGCKCVVGLAAGFPSLSHKRFFSIGRSRVEATNSFRLIFRLQLFGKSRCFSLNPQTVAHLLQGQPQHNSRPKSSDDARDPRSCKTGAAPWVRWPGSCQSREERILANRRTEPAEMSMDVAENKPAGANRRFWSMCPPTRVPFGYRFFEPQPYGGGGHSSILGRNTHVPPILFTRRCRVLTYSDKGLMWVKTNGTRNAW